MNNAPGFDITDQRNDRFVAKLCESNEKKKVAHVVPHFKNTC